VGAVERIVLAYLRLRRDADESFGEAFRRVGLVPFQQVLYECKAPDDAA